MKKMKLYMLLLLVPLVLMGCIEKGSTSAVSSGTVEVNADLAALINSNRNRITTLLDDNVFLQETYLTKANSSLYDLYSAYISGTETQDKVNSYFLSAKSNFNTFLELNNMLNYDEITLTYNKMLSQQSIYSGSTDFSEALARVESKYKAIKSAKESNSYYLEIYESNLLNSDLNGLTTTGKTYKEYLKNLGFLYDSSLADTYENLAQMVLRDINVLKGNTIDFNSLSVTTPYNDLYRLAKGAGANVVLFDANRTNLLNSLNTLYTMYSNYESYTVTQIAQQESSFQSVDRSIFNDLKSTGLKYYLVNNTASAGNKLSINVAVFNELNTDLITKLNSIYTDTSKTLSNSEKNELFILINNLTTMKSKIEGYYLIKPTGVYSSSVISGQFYQIIIDELTFIDSMLKR